MGQIFNTILIQPLLNLLIFFYNVIPFHDLGLAIIILTIIIRLILSPFSRLGIKSQKKLQDLQPKLDEIKKKHAGDMQKQSAAMMNLYRENKINPFSSCLLLLIQLPVLIAFFKVLNTGIASSGLNPIAFGFLNLARVNIFLAGITAYFQYLQMKSLPTKKPEPVFVEKDGAKDENMATRMNKQMTIMMPFMTLLIGVTLPSGLMIYWLISTIFSILEQKLFIK
ncbi:hypothetical protein CO074_00260 [bacterium (Candidatus Moisslbacteria) CG_4_9_14_0_8_um_filter_36_20]|nr:MAG: hypothetical protein CO074_00260 [bacterium (Candidatus Moisslbacteria) CG_4_9_14_0_8_um_filter_36_20]